MYRNFWKHPLRGGAYHASLIFIVASAFNLGFHVLTGVDIAARVFAGMTVPKEAVALGLCISSVVVLWNNWVD